MLDDLTGIGGLRLGEMAEPVPQGNEVLLEVSYAALNPADRYLAERQYPANPPLPTCSYLPFQSEGSQTSNRMSESLVGLATPATRQKAGKAALGAGRPGPAGGL